MFRGAAETFAMSLVLVVLVVVMGVSPSLALPHNQYESTFQELDERILIQELAFREHLPFLC